MCAFVPDVSPGLANPVWRLAYDIFDKIVFGIDTLFDDYLDQVPVFDASAPVRKADPENIWQSVQWQIPTCSGSMVAS
jgi:hypothetical protein